MIPYIDAAMNGQTIYSSEIVDTTWGHIFTACYPVVSSDGSGEIIGALCMEMDMEDTYAYLEKSSQSSFKTACVAVAVSILLAGWSYMILRRQRQRDMEYQEKLQKAAVAANAANRAIRALDRPDAATVPILAMTANAFKENAEKCFAAGMNAHLTKPLRPEEMVRAIARCCDKEKAQ